MKNKNTAQKVTLSDQVKNIIIAGIFSYVAAIFTLPSLGVLAKLPTAFLLSFAASLFCTSKKWILSMMALMPFILNLLYAYELKVALLSAIGVVVAAWFGILARRAFFTALVSKKKKNDKIYFKSIVVLVASVIAGVFVQIVLI